jgi:hypothetical protein
MRRNSGRTIGHRTCTLPAAKQQPNQGLALNSLPTCTSAKIFPPATAGGGHDAKRKRSTKNSQDAFGYLAVSLREMTADGKKIYRRRQIGTVEQIPDLETARKAANLLVPDLNARMAKSKSVSMTIAQLCGHFEQCEFSLANT